MPNAGLSDREVRKALTMLANLHVTGEFYVDKEDKDGQRQKSAMAEVQREMRPDWAGGGTEHALRCMRAAEVRWGATWRDFLPVEKPVDPDDELPDAEAIIESRVREYPEKVKARFQTHNRVIALANDEPFAFALVGDPHLDNPGTDWTKLKEDMDVLRTSGVRAINIGDILDNWPTGGKLAKKNVDADLTRDAALSLARHFVRDSGVNWIAHLLGNHDAWPGHDFHHLMSAWSPRAKVIPWGAIFTFRTPSGFEYRLHAQHDFKGHSMYNELHGLMRRAREDGRCDMYAAGHRHTAAKASVENGHRGQRYDHVRVKGYKGLDEYAFVGGFPEQKEGHSAIVVVDPGAETMEGRATVFHDLGRGVEFLNMLRNRS